MRISRPTLREAVKTLVEAGVLEVRRGQSGGIFVASELVPRELLRSRYEIRVGEVSGVLEARRLIEPRVAMLAAARGHDEDFAAMQRTIDRQLALLDDGGVLAHEDRFLELERQFHLTMARATGNPRLAGIMRSLIRDLEIARDMVMHVPLVADWTIDIHERTLGAIKAGDLERIEAVMGEHLGRMEETWESETGRRLVRPSPTFLFSSDG
jgi:DNA-binding FadR family transcriptional regulator